LLGNLDCLFEEKTVENKEEFERKYMNGFGFALNDQESSLVRGAVQDTWQACTAHHEAERNALLAVIEIQREALNNLLYGAVSALDINEANTVGAHYVEKICKQALALAPNNVRLVEVGSVEIYNGNTGKQLVAPYPTVIFKSDMPAIGTKLYVIKKVRE
jgi:hypothetical protein